MDKDSIGRTLMNEFVEESLKKYNFSGKVLDVGGRINTKSKFKDYDYLHLDMQIDILNYKSNVDVDIIHDLNYPLPMNDNIYDNLITKK